MYCYVLDYSLWCLSHCFCGRYVLVCVCVSLSLSSSTTLLPRYPIKCWWVVVWVHGCSDWYWCGCVLMHALALYESHNNWNESGFISHNIIWGPLPLRSCQSTTVENPSLIKGISRGGHLLLFAATMPISAMWHSSPCINYIIQVSGNSRARTQRV